MNEIAEDQILFCQILLELIKICCETLGKYKSKIVTNMVWTPLGIKAIKPRKADEILANACNKAVEPRITLKLKIWNQLQVNTMDSRITQVGWMATKPIIIQQK